MKYKHTFDKPIYKCRGVVGKRIVGMPNLNKAINSLNYKELLHVSRISNDYVRGMELQTTGVKKVDSLVRYIYKVSRADVNKAKKYLSK